MNNIVEPTYWQRIEGETHAFYERMATAFVSAAAQSRELDAVKTEVQALINRVTNLEEENRKLRSDLSETWEFARRVERERDEAQTSLGQARTENVQLTDTVFQRDATIAQLQAELAEAHNRAQAETNRANDLEHRLEMAVHDTAIWRTQAQETERSNVHLNELVTRWHRNHTVVSAQLQAAREKLAELSKVFDVEQPKEQEPEAPQPPVLLQSVS